MSTEKQFQKDMIKTYRKELWSPFIKAIKDYRLIEDGDKIAVAISGGKDSLSLAKMLEELIKHPLVDFEVVFIAMDPGYTPWNRKRLEENSKKLGIDLKIIDKAVFKIVEEKAPEYPCYLCAKMRRGILYDIAEKEGANKVALGHHFDDVIETTLLNMFYAGTFKTMLPKLSSDNFDGMQLIRPLYYVKETSIKKIMNKNEIYPLDCACSVAAGQTASKREEVKTLIQELKKQNKDIDKTIFNAARNVNLDHVIAWEKDGVKHRFDD